MPSAEPQTIQLVAGLGNPDEDYAHTRHNAGVMALDALAEMLGARAWKHELGALVACVELPAAEGGEAREVLLAKPQSYMNTSGGPLSKLCRAHGIAPEALLVVHDELDLPCGEVRVKVGGGHAGHNGLRSIIDKLGSRSFSRIRIGLGDPPGRMSGADFVLRPMRGTKLEEFELSCARAADVALLSLIHGVVYARDHTNGAAAHNGQHRSHGAQ